MKLQNDLFAKQNPNRYTENRRMQSLFLPEILDKKIENVEYFGKNYNEAYSIFEKWAEMEDEGELASRKESNIEAEFITDIFGKALGYKLFSENLDSWELEPKFKIDGLESDALIGYFGTGKEPAPAAVIELKGPNVNLDRDRFNGRTAVQQCWDYMNMLPDCSWGIVSNIISFRIYHRSLTPNRYEHFALRDLIRKSNFSRFFYIFQRDGLLTGFGGTPPRADRLLEESIERQEEIGDELYLNYNYNRQRLISHLIKPPKSLSLDGAIRTTQKILDRIIFIAFCEDRGLLPSKTIHKAYEFAAPFTKVVNPRWQNFKDLFNSIDQGNTKARISPYNGGLFKEDDYVDNLELSDDWTDFFESVGNYDFNNCINVDVLGHLFERSINDIEKLRLSGFFNAEVEEEDLPKMEKSAERKRGGIFYTPPDFTAYIVKTVVGSIIDKKRRQIDEEMDIDEQRKFSGKPDSKTAELWLRRLEALKEIKIVDPACGSGAFLIRAYDYLEEKYQDVMDHLEFHHPDYERGSYKSIPDFILQNNLYGVDLSPEATEITQLALWIRSAQEGKTLADLSQNIICGNSLVTDKDVDAKALVWDETFPAVFNRANAGFDCVIGNPPWERIKLQEREFFDAIDPKVGSAVSAAQRRNLIKKITAEKPEINARHKEAKEYADRILKYIRTSGRYPLTSNGDVNTYTVFAELAYNIISPAGRVGLLIPSGIATDYTTRRFFSKLVQDKVLICFYDFENKAPVFPDVHRSYKFSIFVFSGGQEKTKSADFAFFLREVKELENKKRHIKLDDDDFRAFNPNTLNCPVFRSEKDAAIARNIYHNIPVLVNRNLDEQGNLWGIRFITMFHQTNDAELFIEAKTLKRRGYKQDGLLLRKKTKIYMPLYEAKSIQAYDHRAASIVIKEINWMRQGQTKATWDVQHQNPDYSARFRWYVDEENVKAAMKDQLQDSYIAYKEITSPTNIRTMIASFIPHAAVVNTAVLITTGKDISKRLECCLLANLNSFVLDFIAKQKVGGVHLSFFIVEQLPILPPDFYQMQCPWAKNQTLEEWISERVLKLTCTANDMIPLAGEAGFEPKIHKWNSVERRELMAELDAAYFHLYKIDRDAADYMLSTFSKISDPGKTAFEMESVREKVLKRYDEFGMNV